LNPIRETRLPIQLAHATDFDRRSPAVIQRGEAHVDLAEFRDRRPESACAPASGESVEDR